MTFGNRKWHFAIQHIKVLKKLNIPALFIFPSVSSYHNVSQSRMRPALYLLGRLSGEDTQWGCASYGYGEDCVGYWLKTVDSSGALTHRALLSGVTSRRLDTGRWQWWDGTRYFSVSPPSPLSLTGHVTSLGDSDRILTSNPTVSTLC